MIPWTSWYKGHKVTKWIWKMFQPLVWASLLGGVACAAHTVPYVVLESGSDAGLRSIGPHFDVFTDTARFEEAFRVIHSNQLAAPEPPQVDFEQSLVILAVLEQKPTAGYTLRIKSVSQNQRTLRVEIQVERPRPGQLLATVVTRPYILIRARKNSFDTVQFIGEHQEILRTISVDK
jgi:hypothetical protein